MKNSKKNSQVTIRKKNNIIAILLSVVVLVWLVAFFLYALAFDMINNLYGTCLFIGTSMLMIWLLLFIINQRYDDDKIIEQKDVQISVLLACYAKVYSDLQKVKRLFGDTQKGNESMDDTKPKDIKSLVENTISDLQKVLSMDKQP